MVRSHIGNVVCSQGIVRSSRILSAKAAALRFFILGLFFICIILLLNGNGAKNKAKKPDTSVLYAVNFAL